MFRMLFFLSMISRIWSTVKFTMMGDGWGETQPQLQRRGPRRAEGGRAGEGGWGIDSPHNARTTALQPPLTAATEATSVVTHGA